MLSLNPEMKIYVCLAATDMRKGISGLSGIVRKHFQADPTDGSLFIFINRRRYRMKMLYFADGGFWLYYCLLEAGTFETLNATDESNKLQIDATELSKQQLIELVETCDKELAANQQELAETKLELLREKDISRQLTEQKRQLEKELIQAFRDKFGRKSERYIADPDQLRIDFGDTDQGANTADGLCEAVEEADLIPAHRRRKPKKKDRSLPAHLPRVETIVDVPVEAKTCPQHGEKTLLPETMWDVREKLVMIPAKFEAHVFKHKKYACQNQPQCGSASTERPTGIVEGDKYDTSVATQIITHKYGCFMTLYHLQNLFAGGGWTPSRGLMLNILTGCHFIIEPLMVYFKQQLLTDRVIACDDTGTTLLYPKVLPDFDLDDPRQARAAEVYEKALSENKSSINAKSWAYRGQTVKLNVFDFTVSRHRDGPELFFENYSGTILDDCWHGFESIALTSGGKIARAAYNAHARRKFERLTDYPADRKKWMDWFWELYDFESEAKEQVLVGEALLSHRRRYQRPVWERMRVELDSIEQRVEQVVLSKSDFHKALTYVLNHWDELTRYVGDAELPIDNNECAYGYFGS